MHSREPGQGKMEKLCLCIVIMSSSRGSGIGNRVQNIRLKRDGI